MKRIFTEEHKRKLVIARKRQVSHRKPNNFHIMTKDWLWKKYVIENLSATKISKLLKCSLYVVTRELKKHNIRIKTFSEYSSGENNPNYNKVGKSATFYGQKHKPETINKMRNLWDKNKKQEFAKRFYGNKNPNWKDGITNLTIHVRSINEYKEWRNFCFERDKFICQFCGQLGKKLNVDHIKPLNVILKENEIITIEQARFCKEIWDPDNGRTLCVECHKTTETYGRPNSNFTNPSWKLGL